MDDRCFDIAELVSKYLANSLTDSERIRLMRWLELSEANRLWFHSVTEADFVGSKRRRLQSINVNEGWLLLLKKKRQNARHTLFVEVLKYASMFVLPILLGTYVFIHRERPQLMDIAAIQEILPGSHKAILQMADGVSVELYPQLEKVLEEKDGTLIELRKEGVTYEIPGSSEQVGQKIIYNHLVVPKGGEYTITLSDGTVVYLNADSRLHFPVKFAEDVREVELEGEGYFQVAKNDTVPFVVKVGDMNVTVTGTEFNISAYKEYEEVRTTLVNGEVKVSSERNEKDCVLLPGEQAVFHKGDQTIKVNRVDVSYAIAWREGLLRFRDHPLKEIMAVVSRWYDVEIVYEDAAVKEYLFGCNFSRYETVFPMLEIFESTGTVRFRIEDKKIIVSKN